MVGCVLSQLKSLGFSILSCQKGLGFFTQLRVESSSGFILYLMFYCLLQIKDIVGLNQPANHKLWDGSSSTASDPSSLHGPALPGSNTWKCTGMRCQPNIDYYLEEPIWIFREIVEADGLAYFKPPRDFQFMWSSVEALMDDDATVWRPACDNGQPITSFLSSPSLY